MEERLERDIEDVALYWERHGVPRIAGRVIGLLLVCDPPYRSVGQIATELNVSKGSASTMTRLLLTSESIERVPVPGERATYYRLKPDSLERKLEARLAMMVGFRQLAEEGVALLEGAPSGRRERLERVSRMYAFMEREMGLMLERWRAEEAERERS